MRCLASFALNSTTPESRPSFASDRPHTSDTSQAASAKSFRPRRVASIVRGSCASTVRPPPSPRDLPSDSRTTPAARRCRHMMRRCRGVRRPRHRTAAGDLLIGLASLGGQQERSLAHCDASAQQSIRRCVRRAGEVDSHFCERTVLHAYLRLLDLVAQSVTRRRGCAIQRSE